MFTKAQQDLLKSVGRNSSHPDVGTPNPQLDEVILGLRKHNPQAFLRDMDLIDRVFINRPASNILLKGYINPFSEEK